MARKSTDLGFSATLPMEWVLRSVSLEEFLELHSLDLAQWDKILVNPAWKTAVAEAEKLVQEEGGAFKMKARSLAQEFLPVAAALVHDENAPPVVRANMIQAMIKFAGLDGSVDQKNTKGAVTPLQINIDLG